jgi:hypothetical protein
VLVIALVVVFELAPPEPATQPVTTTPIEIVPAQPKPPKLDDEPLAVVLLDEPPAPGTSPPPSPSRQPPSRDPPISPSITPPSDPSITTGATIGTEQPKTPGEPGSIAPPGSLPATRNPLFDMRGNGQPDLRLRPELHDDLEHVPAGTRPVTPDAVTGKLHPSGGGTYRSNQGVFTAKVEKDGSVDLKDSSNFHVDLPDPRAIPKAIGHGVKSWYGKDDKTPGGPAEEPVNNNNTADADTRPDHGGTTPVVGGKFDVSDAFMRSHGQDPYASKKLEYLDSTRDERVQIGTKYKQQQLAQSTQLMRRNIEVLWAHTADPAARKQGLFELWDDCAETGDPALVEGGRAARRMVVGVIRARFPAGSPLAFTADELAHFNRKRSSKATFSPYG